jgi:hypothetical protein
VLPEARARAALAALRAIDQSQHVREIISMTQA